MVMKKILIIVLLMVLTLPMVYSAQQKVYILNLKYDNGKITKESLIVTQGFFIEAKEQPETGYRLEVVSFEDKILYTRKFIFPTFQKGPIPNESDILEREKYLPDITKKEPSILKKSSIELMIPYHKNAKLIRIYDSNDIKVLEINVSAFAEKEIKSLSIWQRIINWFKKIF